MTPLDKSLKRALTINARDYVVTLTPDSLKLTEKGRRLGVELQWADLISGDSALAVALQASLGKFAEGAKPLARKAKELTPAPRSARAPAHRARAAVNRKARKRSR